MSSEYLKEVASTSVDAQLSPTQRSHRQLIAALTGVLTAFLNSCMALMAKLATQRRCTTILVMASRGLLSWLFAFMLLVVQRGVPSHKNRDDYVGPRSTWKLMLARVASGSTALFLLLAGVSAMPIGDATVLNFTNLLWTIAFARLFFAEPLRLAHAIGLSLALPAPSSSYSRPPCLPAMPPTTRRSRRSFLLARPLATLARTLQCKHAAARACPEARLSTALVRVRLF